MNVKPAFNTDSVVRTTHPGVTKRIERAEQLAAFGSSATLDQQLTETPDVRPEVVEAAKKLIGLGQYPPMEALDKIARLLAMHLASGADSPPSDA